MPKTKRYEHHNPVADGICKVLNLVLPTILTDDDMDRELDQGDVQDLLEENGMKGFEVHNDVWTWNHKKA